MTHSYTNPSEKQDLAHLEANVEDGVDEYGFSKRKPISDRECIYKCLDNCTNLAGLDKRQVERLAKQFETMTDDTKVESEYPPL